MSLKLS